jgi:hypothetical protein
VVVWERTALPRRGELADQEAWLMAALDHVRDVYQAITLEDSKRSAKETNRGKRR